VSRRRGPIFKATRREEREANRRARQRLGRAVAGDFEAAADAFVAFSTARLGGGPREIRPFTFEFPMAQFRGRLAVSLRQRLREAVETGGRLGMRFRPPAFPRLPPALVPELAAGFIETQATRAVTAITAQTRTGIRRALLDALTDQVSPTETFQRIGRTAGLTSRQTTAVGNFRRELERRLVPVERARTPQIRELIERRVGAYRDRLMRYRGQVIGETEMQAAIQAGERGYYEAAASEGDVDLEAVEKTWFTVQDERVCPICEPLHEETVPFGELFDSSEGALEGPPAHPSCRCFLRFTGEAPQVVAELEAEESG
jgi:hypothetical protein